MLYTLAALLMGIESTPGTAATLSAASDAMLVEDPKYTSDMQKIERKFSKADLSPFPFMIGRRLGQVTFKHEIRSNGLATGLTADAAKLARLFRACGFALLPCSTTADRVSNVFGGANNAGAATWASGGTPNNTEPVMFDLTCTTGGNAAAAKFTVTPNNPDYGTASTNIAASGAISLGTSGATITPTITTNLAIGDRFTVMVWPIGVKLVPVSEGFETATIEVYYEGIKHKLTGAVGTFQFTADAGGIVTAEFTFMGVHNDVVDAALPTGLVFEQKLPALFQDALVTMGKDASLVIKQISFNLSLQAGVREDANAPLGFRGYTLQDRTPQGGLQPEATTEGTHAFWGDYQTGDQKAFFARIGNTVGNTVSLFGPRVQTSSLGYSDSNNNRMYDVGMQFARYAGNDEVMFHFG